MKSILPPHDQAHIGILAFNGDANDKDACRIQCERLADRCQEMADDQDIRVVILDCRHPSWGAMLDACPVNGLSGAMEHPTLIDALAVIPQPVIAAVDGRVMGIGLEALLTCDIRIATEVSDFAMPQILHGTIPHFGGTQRLVRTVGKAAALEMLLTGDPIDTHEARRIGLVNRVVPADALPSTITAMATTMAGKGPISLQYVKEAVASGVELTLQQGMWLEADLYFLLHTTQDRSEGVRAFQEKRPADFKGS